MFDVIDYYIDIIFEGYNNLVFIEENGDFLLRCIERANIIFEAEPL